MKNAMRRMVVVGVIGGCSAILAAPAYAQMRQGQFMSNLMATSAAPNWFGGGFGGNPVSVPGASFVNPYLPAGFSGAFTNPYAPAWFGTASNSWAPGGLGAYYGYPPTIGPGYFLMGTAEIMKAYGAVVTADQAARIMQEQAHQAHIQTLKMRAEYRAWLKANTLSYSEVQAGVAKQILNRIRRSASTPEIWFGESLNLLLHDLEGTQGRKIVVEPIPLSEDLLKHLNVSKKYGNLGLLRDDGRFSWPAALLDILTRREREEVELQAQALVQKAIGGHAPGNQVRDLQNTLERIGAKLARKVNEIPATQYLPAKRFLAEFDSARLALEEPGTAIAYFQFQQWTKGGKTVQELVDYLTRNGLRFAPAVQGDENAYQAVQSALAAYDVAYNEQMTAAAVQNSKE